MKTQPLLVILSMLLAIYDSYSMYNFDTPLHKAVKNDDRASVALLLSSGVNSTIQNSHGNTPLHCAKSAQVAYMLLSHNADVSIKNNKQQTPFYTSICNHNKEVAQLLLFYGSNINEKDESNLDTLYYAVITHDTPMVEFLLSHGIAVNTLAPNNEIALHTAAYFGRNEIVRLLLAYGADITVKNNNGHTPLDRAYYKNQQKTIELIQMHEHILQQAQQPYPRMQVLHQALEHGCYSIVRLLLKKGIMPTFAQLTLVRSRYDQEPDASCKKIYKLLGRIVLSHPFLQLAGPHGYITKSGLIGAYGFDDHIICTIARHLI